MPTSSQALRPNQLGHLSLRHAADTSFYLNRLPKPSSAFLCFLATLWRVG